MHGIKIFSLFGKAFIPKKIAPIISRQFTKAGYSKVPHTLFGMFFYITLGITYIIYFYQIFNSIKVLNPFLFLLYTFLTWVVIPLVLSALLMLGIYFYLDIKIFNRSKDMEDKLADYLTYVSTNLKGGMSFENSLWSAIRPEFGLLSTEMGLISKKVMTGSDLVDSLIEFAIKYPSPIIRRAMNLIISEIESGGKISDLMDRVIEDLKKTRLLKQEMAASTLTYVIFISAIIIVISPVLFSLAYQLLDVMLKFMERFAGLNIQSMPLSFSSEATINPRSFKRFSFFAISMISVFASIILSIIQKGNIRSGIKYIPIFLASSIFMYILASGILNSLFAGLIV